MNPATQQPCLKTYSLTHSLARSLAAQGSQVSELNGPDKGEQAEACLWARFFLQGAGQRRPTPHRALH